MIPRKETKKLLSPIPTRLAQNKPLYVVWHWLHCDFRSQFFRGDTLPSVKLESHGRLAHDKSVVGELARHVVRAQPHKEGDVVCD